MNYFFHYRKLKNFKYSTYCVVFIFFKMFIISKCIITFPSFQKTKQNKQTNKTIATTTKNKTHQIFILDNYLIVLTGDVANMQFTRGLVSSYLLKWLKGKQSSSCMVISLDSTKVLFSINGFQKVSINVI